MSNRVSNTSISDKSGITTLLLCCFLGFLGVHRFYVGRVNTGLLMLVTLGGFGLWWIADTVMVACSEFTDSEGRTIMFAKNNGTTGRYIGGIAAILLTSMVMLVGSIVAPLIFVTDGVVAVTKNQLAAIRAGDYEKAYNYNADGFRRETSFAVFKQFIENYPVIKYNTGISINVREVDGEDGYVQGVVHSKKGQDLPIEYQLTYEHNTWKILGLRVNPADSGDEEANSDSNESASEEGDTQQQSANENTAKQQLSYDDKAGKYSISYPDTWYHENPNENSVLFSGKKGTAAYVSTVTIQTLPMKKVGGYYANAKDVVDDLKQQIKEQATNVKFLREGEAELPTDPKTYKGQYFEVTYTYKGVPMKKIQFIIVNPKSTVAYSWGYTTEAGRFDKDLPIAQGMYESWSIKQ